MPTRTEPPRSTDRIEKRIDLNARRSRVWRALADATEFGTWFGVKLDGPFTPGATVLGQLTIPGYEHVRLEIRVERVELERYFSYRWHPYAVEAAVDYSAEPMTLVEFRLEESAGGKATTLTIVESGFDRLPAHRRAEAFRMNEAGWNGQSKKLAGHVE